MNTNRLSNDMQNALIKQMTIEAYAKQIFFLYACWADVKGYGELLISCIDILDLAFKEKDWATWNFIQWFVKEQIEEEKLALELIDKLKIAGGDRATDESLFTLDKALEAAADEVSFTTGSYSRKSFLRKIISLTLVSVFYGHFFINPRLKIRWQIL